MTLRSTSRQIPDSVALYTKKMCTIPALLMTQTKLINKQAIKSLKYFNEEPLKEVMNTIKV